MYSLAAALAKDTAVSLFGSECVVNMKNINMGAEDFAYYLSNNYNPGTDRGVDDGDIHMNSTASIKHQNFQKKENDARKPKPRSAASVRSDFIEDMNALGINPGVPGAYVRIGSMLEGRTNHPAHSALWEPDERSIAAGI